MPKRRKFNRKRKLRDPPPSDEERSALHDRVSYSGNPVHKRNPGDFNLEPPSTPRPDKTLCDSAGVLERKTALELLRAGVLRGLVSQQCRRGVPQNIWAVTEEGTPLEAQLDNAQQATYHGYPLPQADPLHQSVLEWWGAE